jgi:heptosyltransferase-1
MRILIVKTSSLGDIVQSFDFLSFLKHKFPDAIIDWVVEKRCIELVKSHPYIDNVIEIDTKNKRISSFVESIKNLSSHKYDLAFDIQGNLKSGLVLFFTKSIKKIGLKKPKEFLNKLFTNEKISLPKGFDIRTDYLNVALNFFNAKCPALNFPLLKINTDEEEDNKRILDRCGNKIKVLVAPGSLWENKSLDRGRLLAFLKSKKEKACFILSYGTPTEERDALYLFEHLKDSSFILPKKKLSQLQNLMSKIDLVIAADSLPLHLAYSAGVKTLSFFGPSLKEKYAPKGADHLSFQGSCPFKVTFDKRCPKLRKCDSGECIKNIDIVKLTSCHDLI